MFRAYGTAPAETPGADLYSWTTPIFNKGAVLDFSCSYSASRPPFAAVIARRLQFSRNFHARNSTAPRRAARVMA